MEVVSFGQWSVEVDRKKTEELYEKLPPYSEHSTGEVSQKYLQYREGLFPPDLLEFMEKLGIDWKKDAYLQEGNPPEEIKFEALVDFPFYGNFQNRPEGKEELTEKLAFAIVPPAMSYREIPGDYYLTLRCQITIPKEDSSTS